MLIFLGTILELVQFPFSVIDTKMPPHHHRHHYYSNHSSSWTQIQNGQFRIRYFWIVNLLNLLNLLLPSCLRAGTADEKNSNPQNHQSFRRAQCFGEQQSRLFLELAWVQHMIICLWLDLLLYQGTFWNSQEFIFPVGPKRFHASGAFTCLSRVFIRKG